MNDSNSEVSEEDYQLSLAGRIIRKITSWRIRSYQRKKLMGLSNHLLKDIGLNRYEASKEYEKPFWRP